MIIDLPKGTLVPDLSTLTTYIGKNNDLYRSLVEIVDLCLKWFGDRAQVSVEIYKDPETVDQHIQVVIRQDEYDQDLMEQIKFVHETWYSTGGYYCSSSRIHVCTDFEKPMDVF